jgi:hypothetical protein
MRVPTGPWPEYVRVDSDFGFDGRIYQALEV